MRARRGTVMPGGRRGAPLLGTLVAVATLVTGCATTGAGTVPSATVSHAPGISMGPGVSMAPEMTMAPGVTMSRMGERPSPAAQMVCGPEIRHAIAGILAQPATPPGESTWEHGLFSCTYQLPTGPLVLSVQDAQSVSTGRAYFTGFKGRARNAQPLRGLQSYGLPSFRTATGTVAFLKDGKTLVVNATRQSASVGRQHLSPADLAYAVAADVIACWSE